MKILILGLILSTTAFAGKFVLLGGANLGVMYGQSDVVTNSTMVPAVGATATDSKKFSFKSIGASIGPHIGVETYIAENTFMGLEFGGTIDTTRADVTIEEENHRLVRNYTLTLSARIGGSINKNWDLYLSGGAAYANGCYYYADQTGFKGSKSWTLPGWTAGGGARYALSENTLIGLGYTYESYKAFNSAVIDNVKDLLRNSATVKSKFTPRYHKITLDLNYKI